MNARALRRKIAELWENGISYTACLKCNEITSEGGTAGERVAAQAQHFQREHPELSRSDDRA